MPPSLPRTTIVACLILAFAGGLMGQEEPGVPVAVTPNPTEVVTVPEPEPVPAPATLTLSNQQGAAITFTEVDGLWRWTKLATPDTPAGLAIEDQGGHIVLAYADGWFEAGWTLARQEADMLVFEQQAAALDVRLLRAFSFGPARNVLRIDTWAKSTGQAKTLKQLDLLSLRVEGEAFRETGLPPASFPVFGKAVFAGIEHVSGEGHADGETLRLMQAPRLALSADWRPVAAVVVGWPLPGKCSLLAGEGRIRDAFLQYLDTIRIKPERIELHTNTWWSLPLPFSEKDVLNHIEALRHGFTERTGMFFDSFALDLGWSDPHTVWRIAGDRFPNGLRTINERLAALNCRLGLWISPGSAYSAGLDNAWLQSQGYEVTPTDDHGGKVACFALGGRYQQAVKDSIVGYAREYSLGHVKLDYLSRFCDVTTHAHAPGWDSFFAIDAGLADVLDSLRAVNPRMVLEPLVCGMPPSPWWAAKTPFLLGPHGDDVPHGRVPCPEWMESLISGRDVVYRAHQEQWLMPTQMLETFDIVMQCPGAFQNLATMAVGRGRWFLSTYLKPELMTPAYWDFLAELVRWQREHKPYLVNAQMFGGKPELREAYGYMFHNDSKDLYCVRNPWIEARSIRLPACAAVTEARELRMIYPRRAVVARLEPGEPGPEIVVAPYETAFFATVPAGEETVLSPVATEPEPALEAGPPRVTITPESEDHPNGAAVRVTWSGTVEVPAIAGAELCFLVEGSPFVEHAAGHVMIDGREVAARKTGVAGQFTATSLPATEHWTWFIVPVAAGVRTIHVEVNVPDEAVTLGAFLRGVIPAINEPAPESGAVFPVYRPTERAWSRTLLPMTECSSASGAEAR